jgi:hypothetical protein
MASGISSAASYLSSTTDSLASGATKAAGGGMIIDPFTAVMGGVGLVGNIFGGIMGGNAQQRAAQIQANAANNQALAGLYGQQMAMSQNRLDRGYRSIADMMNIKAATDARADNYRYGMNAHLMKSQSDINQAFVAGGVNMMGNLAGKSMDALNSIIGTNNQLRMADNAFALGRLEDRDQFELQKEAGKFRSVLYRIQWRPLKGVAVLVKILRSAFPQKHEILAVGNARDASKNLLRSSVV